MLSNYINQKLSFDTVAPGILGTNRKGGQLVAMLDYSTAALFGDVSVKHSQIRNVFPQLPAQAGSYLYGKFIFADGTVEVLGEPWIVASTIKAVITRKLIFTIDQDVTEDTERKAREAWLANGISGFKVETVN
jgi:hypothetical protein